MASVTICDHCGKPINKGDRKITISINDVWSFEQLKGSMSSGQRPAPLDRHWDLHWDCYHSTVQGTLEATIGAPS